MIAQRGDIDIGFLFFLQMKVVCCERFEEIAKVHLLKVVAC